MKQKNNIDNDIIKILLRFQEQVIKISDEKYKNIKNIGFTFNFDIKTGVSVKNKFPDEEILKALLMDMRFFILKSSPYNLEKIFDLLIGCNFMVDEIKDIKQKYLYIMDNDILSLSYNNSFMTNRQIFNTILNEDNFHQELPQKGMLKIKSHPVFESMSRFKFNSTIFDLKNIIIFFNNKIVSNFIKYYENNK